MSKEEINIETEVDFITEFGTTRLVFDDSHIDGNNITLWFKGKVVIIHYGNYTIIPV